MRSVLLWAPQLVSGWITSQCPPIRQPSTIHRMTVTGSSSWDAVKQEIGLPLQQAADGSWVLRSPAPAGEMVDADDLYDAASRM